MGEALKEFGKHLLNLALAIAIYLLIQPFLEENYTQIHISRYSILLGSNNIRRK